MDVNRILRLSYRMLRPVGESVSDPKSAHSSPDLQLESLANRNWGDQPGFAWREYNICDLEHPGPPPSFLLPNILDGDHATAFAIFVAMDACNLCLMHKSYDIFPTVKIIRMNCSPAAALRELIGGEKRSAAAAATYWTFASSPYALICRKYMKDWPPVTSILDFYSTRSFFHECALVSGLQADKPREISPAEYFNGDLLLWRDQQGRLADPADYPRLQGMRFDGHRNPADWDAYCSRRISYLSSALLYSVDAIDQQDHEAFMLRNLPADPTTLRNEDFEWWPESARRGKQLDSVLHPKLEEFARYQPSWVEPPERAFTEQFRGCQYVIRAANSFLGYGISEFDKTNDYVGLSRKSSWSMGLEAPGRKEV